MTVAAIAMAENKSFGHLCSELARASIFEPAEHDLNVAASLVAAQAAEQRPYADIISYLFGGDVHKKIAQKDAVFLLG